MFRNDSNSPGKANHDRSAVSTSERDRWTEKGPSRSVVDAVAAVTDSRAESLRPLYEVVDPDALDRLCGGATDRQSQSGGTLVSFRYEGCEVTVSGDGSVEVERVDSDNR